MSIRLKKVQWLDSESYSLTRIAGVEFSCMSILVSEPDGEWKVNHFFGRRYATREEAKAACEQHALERIREAVEEYWIPTASEKERQLELCRLGRKALELAEEARDSRESPFKYNEADKVIDAFDNALTIEEMGLDHFETVEQVFALIDAREEGKSNGN